MNIQVAGGCLNSLCGNTCGLPYADQDIYGVGVLVSYITQAILILALAIGLLVMAIWLGTTKREPGKHKLVSQEVGNFLKDFLSAQCYFGIFLQIAALCSDPDSVDPLNGYALLSVAMTGFLPTTFTLVLLQYQKLQSWYHTGLVCLCWLLATIVFFKLQSNLANLRSTAEIEAAGLRRLYELPSCGGSTALVLCKETIGSSPLRYLSIYYNYSGVLNVHSMPIIWAWSTACLISTLVAQLIRRFRTKSNPVKKRTGIKMIPGMLLRAVSHWITMLVVTVIFGLCLGYQGQMVREYTSMDVIDWDGWTFGQIVAVTVWIPPILEHLHRRINRFYERSHLNDGSQNV
ncbi:hypothetical protein BDV59DRAFT_202636 [Aspergillus ambiguus]|uniref:uncharacterized protein n=1 Tax=Aspergillus ambiguus TaxID=176160 RepID=UPI003CCCB1EF